MSSRGQTKMMNPIPAAYAIAIVVETQSSVKKANVVITNASALFCLSELFIKEFLKIGKQTNSSVPNAKISKTRTSEESLEARSTVAKIPAFRENILVPDLKDERPARYS